jgi:hypothetical protein
MKTLPLVLLVFGAFFSEAALAAQRRLVSVLTNTSPVHRSATPSSQRPQLPGAAGEEMELAKSLAWDHLSWGQVKDNLRKFLGCAPEELLSHSRLTRASLLTDGLAKALLVHDYDYVGKADELYLENEDVIKRFFVQTIKDKNSPTGKLVVALLVLPEDEMSAVKNSDLDRRGYWFYKSLWLGGFQCTGPYGVSKETSFRARDYYLTAYPQGVFELAATPEGFWLNTKDHTLVFRPVGRSWTRADVPLAGRTHQTREVWIARWLTAYPVSNAEYRNGFQFWKEKFNQRFFDRQERYDIAHRKLLDAQRERQFREKSGNRSIAYRFTTRKLRYFEKRYQQELREMDLRQQINLSLIDGERELLGD